MNGNNMKISNGTILRGLEAGSSRILALSVSLRDPNMYALVFYSTCPPKTTVPAWAPGPVTYHPRTKTGEQRQAFPFSNPNRLIEPRHIIAAPFSPFQTCLA